MTQGADSPSSLPADDEAAMTWLQTLNVVDPHHIEECEALFEAYFMQVAACVLPGGLAGACRLKQQAVQAHHAAARAARAI